MLVVAAISYTARHPNRVTHLALINAVSRGERYFTETPSGRIAAALGPVTAEQWEYVSETLVTAGLRSPFPDAGSDVVQDAFGAVLRETWTPSAFLANRQAVREMDVSGELDSIAVPTLVISTAAEPAGRQFELHRELASAIPRARLVRVTSRWAGWDDRDYETLITFLSDGAQHVAASGQPKSESKGVLRTVLFTDIVGHTEMMQRLGDAKGRAVLREHERITRETLKQHGGVEVKTDGDSFMATFASVSAAVECAVALQRAFAQYSETAGEPIVVRMGLNVGEPIEEDGDFFGSAVILAARIKDQASGGEILVPEALRHLLSGKPFLFSDRGITDLKGFEDPVRLYEVRWQE